MVKKFYSEVNKIKTQLKNGEKIEDSNTTVVAKSFNDSHLYHSLFGKVLKDFKNIEK